MRNTRYELLSGCMCLFFGPVWKPLVHNQGHRVSELKNLKYFCSLSMLILRQSQHLHPIHTWSEKDKEVTSNPFPSAYHNLRGCQYTHSRLPYILSALKSPHIDMLFFKPSCCRCGSLHSRWQLEPRNLLRIDICLASTAVATVSTGLTIASDCRVFFISEKKVRSKL